MKKSKKNRNVVKEHNKVFFAPKLTIVTTQHSPATDSYVKNKVKTGTSLGIEIEVVDMCENTLEDIKHFLHSTKHPIILQLPLREDLVPFERDLLRAIHPMHDVDGLHPQSEFIPATALGIFHLIQKHPHFKDVNSICLIGRSKLVGKPLIKLLTDSKYSFSLVHSRTPKNIKKHYLGSSDVIVSAVGIPNFIDPDELTINATVIDVGISKNEENKLCGDCSPKFKDDKFRFATPVPGGVGRLTTTYLMYNVLHSYGAI